MFNKVILMGRLTADPELRQTQSGVSTCQFTVAVDRGYTGQSGERQSDFINIVAWRQTAEFVCRYFGKGRLILIEGELRTRTYDDKRHPDVKHYVTEVYADKVNFTGEKKSDNTSGSQTAQNGSYSPSNTQGNITDPAVSNGLIGADLSDFEEVASDSDLPF